MARLFFSTLWLPAVIEHASKSVSHNARSRRMLLSYCLCQGLQRRTRGDESARCALVCEGIAPRRVDPTTYTKCSTGRCALRRGFECGRSRWRRSWWWRSRHTVDVSSRLVFRLPPLPRAQEKRDGSADFEVQRKRYAQLMSVSKSGKAAARAQTRASAELLNFRTAETGFSRGDQMIVRK